MTRHGGHCGGLWILLLILLCVPSAPLPIRPNAPRDDYPHSAAEKGERSVVPKPAPSNVTRPGVLPATSAHLGFEASGGVDVISRWRKAGAPWSFPPHPREVEHQFHAVTAPGEDSAGGASVGLAEHQFHAVAAPGEDNAGGASVVFFAIVVVLALVGCCVLYVQLDDGGIFSPRRMDTHEASKRQSSQSPLTQQSLSMHPRESGGAVPGRNSLALRASSSTPAIPSASALLLQEPGQPVRVLGSTRKQPPQLPPPLAATPQLLAPVVTKTTGDLFLIHGTVRNAMQESTNIRITRADTGEPYALIHINENAYGCGVLVEIPPQQPIAFFDTQCADAHVSHSTRSRHVSILRADSQGWDPTAEPVVVVAPSRASPGEILVLQPSSGGRPLLQVKLEADGQASRVTLGPDGVKVVSMLEADPRHSELRRLFVNFGVDPLLILCSVVAAIKIGVQ